MDARELFDRSGRVAVVTGGGSGIGRQMADALGELGAEGRPPDNHQTVG